MARAAADDPAVLRVAAWESLADLEHGFFGRRGGVSVGPLASLNVSSRVGDAAQQVAANWQRIGSALPGLDFVRMQQVHGVRVVAVTTADQSVGDADAMLTDRPGVGLVVLTADCVPLLALAPRRGVVMAVHAGWRGSVAGIVAQGLAAGRERYGVAADEWQVALGPSIDGCCYQVEAAIGQQFVDRWGAMPDAWQGSGAHGQLYLRQANTAILIRAGIPAAQIHRIGPCTSCASDAFYSHRRSGGSAGRQASIIGMRRDLGMGHDSMN